MSHMVSEREQMRPADHRTSLKSWIITESCSKTCRRRGLKPDLWCCSQTSCCLFRHHWHSDSKVVVFLLYHVMFLLMFLLRTAVFFSSRVIKTARSDAGVVSKPHPLPRLGLLLIISSTVYLTYSVRCFYQVNVKYCFSLLIVVNFSATVCVCFSWNTMMDLLYSSCGRRRCCWRNKNSLNPSQFKLHTHSHTLGKYSTVTVRKQKVWGKSWTRFNSTFTISIFLSHDNSPFNIVTVAWE